MSDDDAAYDALQQKIAYALSELSLTEIRELIAEIEPVIRATPACRVCGVELNAITVRELDRNKPTRKCPHCEIVLARRNADARGVTACNDAASAKRFRDKAAEADQLICTAQTESRRDTLSRISQSYIRTAEQMEKLTSI